MEESLARRSSEMMAGIARKTEEVHARMDEHHAQMETSRVDAAARIQASEAETQKAFDEASQKLAKAGALRRASVDASNEAMRKAAEDALTLKMSERMAEFAQKTRE